MISSLDPDEGSIQEMPNAYPAGVYMYRTRHRNATPAKPVLAADRGGGPSWRIQLYRSPTGWVMCTDRLLAIDASRAFAGGRISRAWLTRNAEPATVSLAGGNAH
jgi:hypothetical protein